jgi:hypothetical protein
MAVESTFAWGAGERAGKHFTTEDTEGTEAGKAWGSGSGPFFIRSDLSVLCALCGEKSGNHYI